MFRTTIVVWLVLLVLALNVVAFVTRIAEKCRLANRFSKCSETTVSILQSQEPAILKHQQTRPHIVSVCFFIVVTVGHSQSEKCRNERLGGCHKWRREELTG
jgi:hypothetical protein